MPPLTEVDKAKRKAEILALPWKNLEEDEFNYVVEDFDSIDTDGSGGLSRDEVIKYLSEDCGVSQQECEEYLSKYDGDSDGNISLVEFLQASGHVLEK